MSWASVRGITIGTDYAKKQRRLDLTGAVGCPISDCSQRDAVEILKLPFIHVDAIAESYVGSVKGKYAWVSIQNLAEKRITLAEMCSRTGVHGTRLDIMLDESKLPRRDAFGWIRTNVTDFIEFICL